MHFMGNIYMERTTVNPSVLRSGTTFEVADVPRAADLLPESTCQAMIEAYLDNSIEACATPTAPLVNFGPYQHPFIAAVGCAFAQHRPLVLSPDHIWLLLCQGLAQHVNAHAHTLRPMFVRHPGQARLAVRRDDFVKGSPDNPWENLFAELGAQIRAHVGHTYDLLVPRFSTTGVTEKAAYEITLMDAMQQYFEYNFTTLCGIPAITLEGTCADWAAIIERVQQFRAFQLDWWVCKLLPILRQFARAAQGQVDRAFWAGIYKAQGESGGPYLTGWIIKFFPYIQSWDYPSGQVNPFVQRESRGPHDGLTPNQFPSRQSAAPFTWHYRDADYAMRLVAGFLGVSQNHRTKALRPEISWAVQDLGAA
jgi:hypothetical protein